MFNITESVLSDKRILNASAAQEKEIYTVGTKTPFQPFPVNHKMSFLETTKLKLSKLITVI